MTGHGDVTAAVAALDAGAVTFVEKPFSKAQLVPAVELAFSKVEQPEHYRAQLLAAHDRVNALADREQAVLSMLGQDWSSDQIAGALRLPLAEIDLSRALILQQLEVESIPAALTIAFAARRSQV